jgi:hypothetical protein
MTCNLFGGTFSQMLNASISFPQFSLPGLYLNGLKFSFSFFSEETNLESFEVTPQLFILLKTIYRLLQ